MADIVLFGATGYTGRLVTGALARRGLDFAVAGRDAAKLQALAREHGDPEVRVAAAGDVDSLVRALTGARVLTSCVGPFRELGWTAVEAALRSGVAYVDSTGEGAFVHELVERYDRRARDGGITIAPALGFDEVVSDVALTLAVDGLERPDAIVTYAVPTSASRGTVRSALGILTSPGWRVAGGRLVETRTGERDRWAPLPPPLGVRRSVSAPLAIGRIAPLHLELGSLDVFMTTGELQRVALRAGLPVARRALAAGPGRALADAVIGSLPEGPGGDARRKRWTVMAEAGAGDAWRHVVLTGEDVYGLTAELIAGGAAQLAQGQTASGVVAPVEARGLETLQKELTELGVSIDEFASGPRGRGD